MAYDREAYEAEYKRKEGVVEKLRILGEFEGCELADAARVTADFLETYSEYVIGEELVNKVYDAAEETCDDYFNDVAANAAYELKNGYVTHHVLELNSINGELSRAGLNEVWPEGYTKPTEEELEAGGVCGSHPYMYYGTTPPTNGCTRCVRLWTKADEKRAAQEAEREAQEAEREAKRAAKVKETK